MPKFLRNNVVGKALLKLSAAKCNIGAGTEKFRYAHVRSGNYSLKAVTFFSKLPIL